MWQGSIIFLGVENLEEMDKFYRGLLNFNLEKDQGLCRIYNIPGGGKIAFSEHIEKTIAEKSPILTLLTEQVDEVYNKLKKKNIVIKSLPKENKKFNIYHFFLEDPAGYTVEIQKFLS